MKNCEFLDLFVKKTCNPKDYAKSFAHYLSAKTQISRDFARLINDAYSSVLDDEDDLDVIISELIPDEYLLSPISVAAVVDGINQTNVYVPFKTIIRAIYGRISYPDYAQDVSLEIDYSSIQDTLYNVLKSLSDDAAALIEGKSSGTLNIQLPYVLKSNTRDDITYDIVLLDSENLIPDDTVTMLMKPFHSITINAFDFVTSYNKNVNSVTAVTSMLDAIGDNETINSDSILSKFSLLFGSSAKSVYDDNAEVLSMVSNVDVDNDTKLYNLLSFIKSQDEADLNLINSDDDNTFNIHDGLLVRSSNYTGSISGKIWDSTSVRDSFSSILTYTKGAITFMCKLVIAALKKVWSIVSKLWVKFVKPMFVSTDFDESKKPFVDDYCDIPMVVIGDVDRGVPYTNDVMKDIVNSAIMSQTNKTYDLSLAKFTLKRNDDGNVTVLEQLEDWDISQVSVLSSLSGFKTTPLKVWSNIISDTGRDITDNEAQRLGYDVSNFYNLTPRLYLNNSTFIRSNSVSDSPDRKTVVISAANIENNVNVKFNDITKFTSDSSMSSGSDWMEIQSSRLVVRSDSDCRSINPYNGRTEPCSHISVGLFAEDDNNQFSVSNYSFCVHGPTIKSIKIRQDESCTKNYILTSSLIREYTSSEGQLVSSINVPYDGSGVFYFQVILNDDSIINLLTEITNDGSDFCTTTYVQSVLCYGTAKNLGVLYSQGIYPHGFEYYDYVDETNLVTPLRAINISIPMDYDAKIMQVTFPSKNVVHLKMNKLSAGHYKYEYVFSVGNGTLHVQAAINNDYDYVIENSFSDSVTIDFNDYVEPWIYMPSWLYDISFSIYLNIDTTASALLSVNNIDDADLSLGVTLTFNDFSVIKSPNSYYHNSNRYPRVEWHNETQITWHSQPVGDLSDDTLNALMQDITNPVDKECACVSRFKFGAIEVINDDSNNLRFLIYLNPINATELFHCDEFCGGMYPKYFKLNDQIRYSKTAGETDPITLSVDEFPAHFIDRIESSFNFSDSFEDDTEFGDLQAARGLYGARYLMDLFFWILLNPDAEVTDFIHDVTEELDFYLLINDRKDEDPIHARNASIYADDDGMDYVFQHQFKIFGFDTTLESYHNITRHVSGRQVDNQDLYCMCSMMDNLTEESAAKLMYIYLFYILTNKIGYMRVYRLLLGVDPGFFPYVICDGLKSPRWHVKTDEELQRNIDIMCTTIISAAAIALTAIVVGAISIKVKRVISKRATIRRQKQAALSRRSQDYIMENEDLKNKRSSLKKQIKEAQQDGDDQRVKALRDELSNTEASLDISKSNIKDILKQSRKNDKALRRWDKLASLLGAPNTSQMCASTILKDDIFDIQNTENENVSHAGLTEDDVYELGIATSDQVSLAEMEIIAISDKVALRSDVTKIEEEVGSGIQNVGTGITGIGETVSNLASLIKESSKPAIKETIINR